MYCLNHILRMKESSTDKHAGSTTVNWDSHRHTLATGNSSFQSAHLKNTLFLHFALIIPMWPNVHWSNYVRVNLNISVMKRKKFQFPSEV